MSGQLPPRKIALWLGGQFSSGAIVLELMETIFHEVNRNTLLRNAINR